MEKQRMQRNLYHISFPVATRVEQMVIMEVLLKRTAMNRCSQGSKL